LSLSVILVRVAEPIASVLSIVVKPSISRENQNL
jgi:hypothetical protein